MIHISQALLRVIGEKVVWYVFFDSGHVKFNGSSINRLTK